MMYALGVISFLVIICIRFINICPPSKDGIGSRFATQIEIETIDRRYKNALKPDEKLVFIPSIVIEPIEEAALAVPVISFSALLFLLTIFKSASTVFTKLFFVFEKPVKIPSKNPLSLFFTSSVCQAKG